MSGSQNHTGTHRLAILGCGFMGTAILQGLLNQTGKESGWHFTACVRSQTSLDRLHRELEGHENVTIASTADTSSVKAAEEADIVMLGCVPADLDAMLATQDLTQALANRNSKSADKVIISLLAGTSTRQLLDALGSHLDSEAEASSTGKTTDRHFDVVRVIPSIGAKIGDSVTVLAKSEYVSDDGIYETVTDLFNRIGSVIPVPERLMNDATAVGAACHALSILALDAITDAAVAEGFDRNSAALLAAESLRSSTNLFCAGGMTPEQLKTAMSTPQGITINSVLRLQSGHVPSAVADAVREAVRYARSM